CSVKQSLKFNGKSIIRGFNEIHVLNTLPNNVTPLIVRCQSKDNDLGGDHTLHVKDDFHWKITGTTTFFCFFLWGSKQQSVQVFNAATPQFCGRIEGAPGPVCYWEVKADGFYVSSHYPAPRGYFTKVHDW
ncbi:unnamed protein product, partial [Ilex paraguariensis]